MIKKEELRIGNILNYTTAENDIYKITIDWEDLQWISQDPKRFNLFHDPIPLTEESLLKFGFSKVSSFYILGDVDSSHFEIKINSGFKVRFSTDLQECELKFVHQLQNIYFALTEKEL
jgi:hypothetical protein